jgi:hypothetical protein
MPATNQQVQNTSDVEIRPLCDTIVELHIAVTAFLAAFGDVYANLTASNPSTTWTDSRGDGPPHLATPNDLLAFNTFATNLKAMIEGDAQWPIVQDLSVQHPAP